MKLFKKKKKQKEQPMGEIIIQVSKDKKTNSMQLEIKTKNLQPAHVVNTLEIVKTQLIQRQLNMQAQKNISLKTDGEGEKPQYFG